MSQVERQFVLLNEHMSTRVGKTIPQLAKVFGVAPNTIKNDLFFLMKKGEVYPKDLSAKPILWFASQPTGPKDMTLELAYALKSLTSHFETQLPTAVFKELTSQFEAANESFTKSSSKKSNNTILKFARATKNIDFCKHVAVGNITEKSLRVIKDVIFSEGDLECDSNNEHELLKLTQISLIEENNRLYLSGVDCYSPHQKHKVDTADIRSVTAQEFLAWVPRSINRAV